MRLIDRARLHAHECVDAEHVTSSFSLVVEAYTTGFCKALKVLIDELEERQNGTKSCNVHMIVKDLLEK